MGVENLAAEFGEVLEKIVSAVVEKNQLGHMPRKLLEQHTETWKCFHMGDSTHYCC